MPIELVMSGTPWEQVAVYKLYFHRLLGFDPTLRGRAARLGHYSSATSCSMRPWDCSVGTPTLGRSASYSLGYSGDCSSPAPSADSTLDSRPAELPCNPPWRTTMATARSTTKLGADCAPMLTTFCSIAVLRAFKVHLPPELAVGLLPFVMLAPNFWYANRHRRTAGRKMRSRKSQRGDICPHALAHVQF
jgi:hypothetical protein